MGGYETIDVKGKDLAVAMDEIINLYQSAMAGNKVLENDDKAKASEKSEAKSTKGE